MTTPQMSEMSVVDVLTEARERLSDPKRWFAPHVSTDPNTPCYCLGNTVHDIAGADNRPLWTAAYKALATAIDGRQSVNGDHLHRVWSWNDNPARTHADVLALLNVALASARVGERDG